MNWLDRNRDEQQLDAELRFDFEQRVEEKVRAGMSEAAARRAVRLEFGGIEQVKEECRDARPMQMVDDLLRDLRYAGRSLRRNPGFAALAVAIMALGIGANTAVFSVVNAVLLKPLAWRDSDRIVTLTNPSKKGASVSALETKLVSIPNFNDWRSQSSSFEAMAYYNYGQGAVMPGSTAEYAQLAEVSPGFFRVFGVTPVIGRFFSADEEKDKNGGALIISYAYWQSRFGGDAGVVGRIVRVYDNVLPIVGVLPPGFHFPDKTDLWLPHGEAKTAKSRDAQEDFAIGLLKPGVSLARAQAEMTTIAARLERDYPNPNRDRTVALMRIQDDVVGDVRPMLFLLWGAVSVVLLIACANTATLLLGKAMARTREVAVRVAMGASRRRIIGQLITESMLLAVAAGGAGLLLAYGGSKALVALAPADLPRLSETGIDPRVLAFTLGISLTTSLLFGLLPALHTSNVDLNGALKQAATRSVTGGGMVRMRGVLVVAEVALAVVLLSGAGLLTRSFVALQNAPLGFRPENVLVMRATSPAATTEEANRFFSDVLSRIATLPDVTAAGATMVPPGYAGPAASGSVLIDHLPEKPDWSTGTESVLSVVAPGTFRALGIPLRSGRDFSDSDTLGKPFVAVVNQALVRRAFPGENPVGRTVFCPFDSLKGMTIVGVVGDVRQRGPEHEPTPECYMTYRQHQYNESALSIVVRTAGDPNALTQTLRRVALETSPNVPVTFTTMETIVSEDEAAPRFRTLLFGIFAALAVCLAMAGVYGVTAYAAGQRSTEMGLRMALGASGGSVLRLVLGQGVSLAGVGLVLGLATAVAVTRLLTTMLFQVQPNDPVVYLAVAGLLGAVALVASYVPALRATKVDPAIALRYE